MIIVSWTEIKFCKITQVKHHYCDDWDGLGSGQVVLDVVVYHVISHPPSSFLSVPPFTYISSHILMTRRLLFDFWPTFIIIFRIETSSSSLVKVGDVHSSFFDYTCLTSVI